MGAINTRVVRRSCALLGVDFAYQEFSKSRSAVQAHVATALGGLLARSLKSSFGRRILKRLSPAPGTGPTEHAMEHGWFRCEFFARSADGRTARAMVSGQGDPANRITVKCVCESAPALACDFDRLPDRAGVLTPASGLGQPLQNRLQARGIEFTAVP